jgi:hypothetical protein
MHLQALEEHIGEGVVDIVVVNTRMLPKASTPSHVHWVKPDAVGHADQRVIYADLISEALPGHHDSHKLAGELLEIIK